MQHLVHVCIIFVQTVFIFGSTEDATLTFNCRGTAVIDLCDFLQPGSFLDVGQQGIPSSASSARLEFRRL